MHPTLVNLRYLGTPSNALANTLPGDDHKPGEYSVPHSSGSALFPATFLLYWSTLLPRTCFFRVLILFVVEMCVTVHQEGMGRIKY